MSSEGSEEKVKEDEGRSQEKQNNTPGDWPARNSPQGTDKARRHRLQARLLAPTVKRTDHRIARKAAANLAGFVVNPDGNFITPAPHQCRAAYKHKVAHQSKHSQSRTSAPMHNSSQAVNSFNYDGRIGRRVTRPREWSPGARLQTLSDPLVGTPALRRQLCGSAAPSQSAR